jgi:hypothetical protein
VQDKRLLALIVVVDVSFIDNGGWAVIEFTASWGEGLNSCDPDKVVPRNRCCVGI